MVLREISVLVDDGLRMTVFAEHPPFVFMWNNVGLTYVSPQIRDQGLVF